jgi:predicted RNase H-like nuclease (RuvC/YqgF family)
MDTITQMQEKQFEANELQAKLRREIVEEQSRTAAAEEEIKRLGNEMIDLRQAAGPTADLIKQLREDLERAKVVRLHAGM